MSETTEGETLSFEANLPHENLGSTLDNYTPRDEQGAYAKALALELVAYSDGPAGLMLVGAAGSGKTHLGVGIARAVQEAGGRAAFVPVKDGNPSLVSAASPKEAGLYDWHGKEGAFVALFDVIVVDDVPGSMFPGVRSKLQRIVLEAFNQAKKVVLTSNQPANELVLQIAQSVDTGFGASDLAIGVAERMQQVWQTVEFTGESFRSGQSKWWRGIERPVTMPRTIDALVVELRDAQAFPRVLGAIVLEVARALGVESTSVAELEGILTRLQGKETS